MMLAIYVAAPEVENRRRSLATKAGMRRAMREGRYCNRAPKGYKRIYDAERRAMIIPDEDAAFVQDAFRPAAETARPLEHIRQELTKKGFQCSKNQFTLLLRNPLYAGKILLPAWQGPSGYEPEELVDGLHEALVSEHVFRRVQGRFERDRYGRKQRGKKGSVKLREELPLRGHLLCSVCRSVLTGSASRGNGGRYWYYFCQGCNQVRFRADEAHDAFAGYLDAVAVAPEVAALYGRVVEDLSREERTQRRRRQAELAQALERVEEKLFRTDEAFVGGKIAADAYERLRGRYLEEKARLQSERESLEPQTGSFAEQVRFTVGLLSNLGNVYRRVDYLAKHALVGSIFPEKLIFADGDYRTSPQSDVIALFGGKSQKKEDAGLSLETGVLLGSPGRNAPASRFVAYRSIASEKTSISGFSHWTAYAACHADMHIIRTHFSTHFFRPGEGRIRKVYPLRGSLSEQ